jgi:hypothetical protein
MKTLSDTPRPWYHWNAETLSFFNMLLVWGVKVVLNLGLSLKLMKWILIYYGTVNSSNGQESHGVSLEVLVKRDGGKLPSFLASVSVEVIVW